MQIGLLVKSTTGRDKDRYYIVTRIVDERIVEVVDGVIKKLDSPKKKNIKHLEEIELIAKIEEKLKNNKQLFDKEINKAINTIVKSQEKTS